MDRRYFLKSSGIALASFSMATALPAFLKRTALARTIEDRLVSGSKRKVLIAIFQRGAVDGLNMIVPYGEPLYYSYRPNLAIAQPGSSENETAIDLDGFFGLHPALKPLKSLYDEKQLAIIHAVGSPDNTRSHFDAQDFMESATPGLKSTQDGWLNRYLSANVKTGESPFRAVALGTNLPRSLQGRAPAIAISNISDFTLKGGPGPNTLQVAFEGLYGQTADYKLGKIGQEAFDAINFLKKANPAQYKPVESANYPRGRFGDSLRQIAQLIKAEVGLEVAFTDIGGWDTHVNQGAGQGQLAERLKEFSQGLAAIATDLGPRLSDVVILTMSEFGRTVRENGTRGTDHGHANCMLVLGGAVKGGKVYGRWPGLSADQLYEGRDLDLTADFRSVFTEVLTGHFAARNLAQIFPGYTAHPEIFHGIIA